MLPIAMCTELRYVPLRIITTAYHSAYRDALLRTISSAYDTEQDGMKIASHSNLPYFLHPKGLKNSSCKLPDVSKYIYKVNPLRSGDHHGQFGAVNIVKSLRKSAKKSKSDNKDFNTLIFDGCCLQKTNKPALFINQTHSRHHKV